MRILVAAGPTREFFDSVRFISNPSRGKMGYAVAAEAACRGHKVDLVSEPV
jgi:phosphopantothenoylcysteine decarboxylase/phosphopantothenate--cysteine ligase